MEGQLYDWFGMNQQLFLIINRFHTPALDNVMLLVTALGHPKLFPFYIALALVIMWRNPTQLPARNVATFAVSYVLLSLWLIPLAKAWFDFPRPVSVLGKQYVTLLGHSDPVHAFPSGHAAFAILLALSLAPGTHWLVKWTLVLFAALVCVSRISVGAHFPADIMGSLFISVPVVMLVRLLLGASRWTQGRPIPGRGLD